MEKYHEGRGAQKSGLGFWATQGGVLPTGAGWGPDNRNTGGGALPPGDVFGATRAQVVIRGAASPELPPPWSPINVRPIDRNPRLKHRPTSTPTQSTGERDAPPRHLHEVGGHEA